MNLKPAEHVSPMGALVEFNDSSELLHHEGPPVQIVHKSLSVLGSVTSTPYLFEYHGSSLDSSTLTAVIQGLCVPGAQPQWPIHFYAGVAKPKLLGLVTATEPDGDNRVTDEVAETPVRTAAQLIHSGIRNQPPSHPIVRPQPYV